MSTFNKEPLGQNATHGNDCHVGQSATHGNDCRVGQNATDSKPLAASQTVASSALFIELVLRLRHYTEAAILWVALKEHADEQPYKTSTMLMAHVDLVETVDRKTVHRAFKSLEERGLISLRVQSRTATRITVHRDAVLKLLGPALSDRLPGLDTSLDFPFLHAWAADRESRITAA